MGKFYNIAKINTHIVIPNIIIYFCQLNFSFKINLEDKIVTTIELVVITEIIETFPSNKENLLNIDDDTSNKDCNIKYFLLFIFLSNFRINSLKISYSQ